MQHGRGDRHDVRTARADPHHLLAEHLRPGELGRRRRRSGRRVEGADLVQAVVHVILGRRVAEPLAGNHVHQHRGAEVAGPLQRMLDCLLVMAVDGAEVLQAEVLEEHLRLQHVLEALLDAVQRVEQRRADQRRVRQRGLDVVEHLLVSLRDADRGEVVGDPADRRLVGAAVVVDDDDQPPVLGRGDVVQRLPGHAAGQRAVADDGDYRAVRLAAYLVGLGQPIGVGQAGGGVRVLDHVVLGLGPARVAGDTAAMRELGEAGLAAGQQLVHVRLVAGIEQDPVDRRVEDPVQRDGQLNDAQVRPEVTAVDRYRLDQKIADLCRKLRQFVRAQFLEVPRTGDGLQQCHLVAPSRSPSETEPD